MKTAPVKFVGKSNYIELSKKMHLSSTKVCKTVIYKSDWGYLPTYLQIRFAILNHAIPKCYKIWLVGFVFI